MKFYDKHIPDEELATYVCDLEDAITLMGRYIGLLSIEVDDLISLASAQGFRGWPKHRILGERIRSELGVAEDWEQQLVARAKLELARMENEGVKNELHRDLQDR